VDRLLDEGFEVTVLDNFSAGHMQNVLNHNNTKRFHLVQGDIRNATLVKKVAKDVDAVFHQAALVDVALSVEDPLLFNDVNVVGTLTLLNACLDSNVKRFIFASSAAVYGDSVPAEKSENMLPKPMSPYAVSKLAAEYYVRAFHELYDLGTVSLRYFNVYGPRQGFASSYSGVITVFISQLLKGQPPVIHGDGNQTRDFVHVHDVVSANMLAFQSNNVVGEVFNVASGTSMAIKDLAKILQKITRTEHLRPIFTDSRPGDVRSSLGNINKAEKLGFHPKVQLGDGLSKLIEWYIRVANDTKESGSSRFKG
jgi:nucleoside-diphosphate-sugar epimerase